ncbi:hypothetical protein BUALT_Bualt10G0050000 [Buddleja alternifolia]|uniref:KIB1-4 beta-propeller domain-containing protein n=1 Tax=Buddleja alternifolia TaxID=168488 RepID=A0AAV6X0X9_9LAMI|nr:hypothetical protein BUALT_Bualt10G0050000 [Buddleja alternifolia]
MSSPKRSPDSRTYPEWTDLPIELSAVVANRLTSIHDYVSFRGVCKLWRLAATFDNFDRGFPRVPWLMYVTKEERTKKGFFGPHIPRVANFLDVSMNKTYRSINFPPTCGRRYLSCNGWILNVSGVDVELTHPVWRIRIELPGLNPFSVNRHGNCASTVIISKMVLSSSPTLKTDLVVMVIWGSDNQLGFCRPGDSSWTIMASWNDSFSDIIYHNGRLYALDDSRRVVECDIHGANPTEIRQVFELPSFDPNLNLAVTGRQKLYLVETSGKFLIISRRFNLFKTLSFKVFEFDLMDGSHNEVHDLGNKALFLGFNSSFSLELSDWNEVKPNCIYFTDHLGLYKDRDVSVYCLLDASINSFVHGITRATCAPATWVVPSL